MEILFITDNFPPEVNAPATRTYEHCKHWVEAGAEVTVLTCAPNFPQGKTYDGYKNRLMQKEKMNGIEVIRVWSYITANEGVIKRTLDYFSFAFSGFWAGLFQESDVIIATSPQFFTTWAACALAALKRKPWVFELRDLWPESIKAVGALDDGLIYDSLEKIELFLYNHADLIVPNTPAFKNRLCERGVENEKISVIPNGTNQELFSPRQKDEQLTAELGLQDKFIVGYLGTHGLAHNLDFILDCASSVNDPGIAFLLIGDGAEKNNLLKQAERLSLDNVTFLDPIPKESAPSYLSVFDVALVPLKRSDTFKTVIPSKIFEAAAMQKPVLLGVDGQAKKLVEDYEIGICYEPENEDAFHEKLGMLKNNGRIYQQCTANTVHFTQDYSRSKLAKRMLDEISGLR